MPARELKPIELGTRFGRLVVNERVGSNPPRYETTCDCGTVSVKVKGDLVHGRTRSCGCLLTESRRRVVHGMARRGKIATEYKVWRGMLDRCHNPKADKYQYYGGRGITVCERWEDFDRFYTDMGARPPGTTLDRLDNDGSYEPTNCRWATRAEQAKNRSNSARLVHEGTELTLIEWAERAGVKASILATRLRRGWSVERALAGGPRLPPGCKPRPSTKD